MPFRHAHANLAALHNANLPPSLAQYTYSAAVVNATNFSEPYMYMSINKVPHSNDSNSDFCILSRSRHAPSYGRVSERR
jgi:hypothetical protein